MGAEKSFSSGGSSDRRVLEDTFGSFPVTLTESDTLRLMAMHRVTGWDNSIYKEIADRIDASGDIVLDARY